MTGPAATGTLTIEGDLATISFERRLAHPAEAVWAALTDPEQRARWLGSTTLERRPGGAIETMPNGPPVAPDVRRMTGRILVWDPPRVLEHEWRQQVVGELVVRYELVPDRDGTILRFTHRGFRPDDARGYLPGEHAYLDRLEALLDGRTPPGWFQRNAELSRGCA
jgi:uncharacterized protein YndB with AHSA1/START domain